MYLVYRPVLHEHVSRGVLRILQTSSGDRFLSVVILTLMRRVLQFVHPARDFRCDLRVILSDATSLGVSCGVEMSSDNGDSCCIVCYIRRVCFFVMGMESMSKGVTESAFKRRRKRLARN